MKKLLLAAMAVFALTGCASDLTEKNVTYESYGFINSTEVKNPCVTYELDYSSVFWGVILVETLLAPIYFFGFDLYEPQSVDQECLKNLK